VLAISMSSLFLASIWRCKVNDPPPHSDTGPQFPGVKGFCEVVIRAGGNPSTTLPFSVMLVKQNDVGVRARPSVRVRSQSSGPDKSGNIQSVMTRAGLVFAEKSQVFAIFRQTKG